MANRLAGWKLLGLFGAIALPIWWVNFRSDERGGRQLPRSQNIYKTQPLVMKGGDPYIRALMRTITASEANVAQPYHVLYGGKYVADLSDHPNRCVPIVTGPNIGQCSTAAGRYQFLNITWYEKAERYHPNPSNLLWWQSYSFEPKYQDAVVYAWLSDPQAWGVDISQRLREGELEEVLRLLSGTWTSLGYGIESNSMSPYLSQIYKRVLREELKSSQV
ncbi:glycoside hydrolase [Hydrococcus rivularis NIES-593]|uniref:Glycoside hydrolase n=1 Tax=Hydrococcus rivularis NIES-593 TaxID=1921803 RepID=A0A1U7HE74_9CYAN|nr:glycoside hydrolase family protein [Hydrococcus rivularis]OKH21902.1 glycoside hydrolase [Hydrococcus rivularis NIES-593]